LFTSWLWPLMQIINLGLIYLLWKGARAICVPICEILKEKEENDVKASNSWYLQCSFILSKARKVNSHWDLTITIHEMEFTTPNNDLFHIFSYENTWLMWKEEENCTYVKIYMMRKKDIYIPIFIYIRACIYIYVYLTYVHVSIHMNIYIYTCVHRWSGECEGNETQMRWIYKGWWHIWEYAMFMNDHWPISEICRQTDFSVLTVTWL
jgi:hypothetical protein